jgi:putative SOS response-associated peptidase YedK
MVMMIDGLAYFHFFSTLEKGWTYQLAPDKYQTDPDWWKTPREVSPTENVLIHRLVGKEISAEWDFWTLVPPWIEESSHLATTSAGRVRLAHAFFEWSDTDLLAGRPKLVGRYKLTGGRIMPLAGIWSAVQIEGREVLTASVVTAGPEFPA